MELRNVSSSSSSYSSSSYEIYSTKLNTLLHNIDDLNIFNFFDIFLLRTYRPTNLVLESPCRSFKRAPTRSWAQGPHMVKSIPALFTDFLYLVLSANRVWLGKDSTSGFSTLDTTHSWQKDSILLVSSKYSISGILLEISKTLDFLVCQKIS